MGRNGVRPFAEMMQSAGGGGSGTVATATPPLVITGADIAISPASAIAAGSMSAADFSKLALYASTYRSGWDQFGLGLDGAVAVSANTTASTNLYPTTYALSNNARHSMAGFLIECSVSATIDAGCFLSANGGDGAAGGGAGTAPGVGSFAAASGAAGAGALGAGGTGTNLTNQMGGRGGAGGAGSGGAGGAAGTRTVPTATRGGVTGYQVARMYLIGINYYAGGTAVAAINNGGGGGGGGGDGAVSGGGGGSGAQAVCLKAPVIVNNGTIEANGGGGGTPASGNAGGGGPGGGGIASTVCHSYSGSGTLRALKGTPGNGSGTGAAGSIATATDGVTAQWSP